jgi:hypothetical protein
MIHLGAVQNDVIAELVAVELEELKVCSFGQPWVRALALFGPLHISLYLPSENKGAVV